MNKEKIDYHIIKFLQKRHNQKDFLKRFNDLKGIIPLGILKKRLEEEKQCLQLDGIGNDLWTIKEYIKNIDTVLLEIEKEETTKQADTIPEEKEQITKSIPTLTWLGSQNELIELIKSLIEAKKIQGTQKEVFEAFRQFFGQSLSTPDQQLTKMKQRNYDNETKFLDVLKQAFKEWLGK